MIARENQDGTAHFIESWSELIRTGEAEFGEVFYDLNRAAGHSSQRLRQASVVLSKILDRLSVIHGRGPDASPPGPLIRRNYCDSQNSSRPSI